MTPIAPDAALRPLAQPRFLIPLRHHQQVIQIVLIRILLEDGRQRSKLCQLFLGGRAPDDRRETQVLCEKRVPEARSDAIRLDDGIDRREQLRAALPRRPGHREIRANDDAWMQRKIRKNLDPEPASELIDDGCPHQPGTSSPPTPSGNLLSVERSMIAEALEKARFNKSKAAKALGLTRQQLYVRVRRYGLE